MERTTQTSNSDATSDASSIDNDRFLSADPIDVVCLDSPIAEQADGTDLVLMERLGWTRIDGGWVSPTYRWSDVAERYATDITG